MKDYGLPRYCWVSWMRVVKYSFCICISIYIAGCGHFTTQKELSTILDSRVEKSYLSNTEEKLIKENESFKEYQFRVTKHCSWIIKVNKKTNIVESWQYSSEAESCQEGVGSYG